MQKRLQNKVAESRLLLTFMLLYGAVVWGIRFFHNMLIETKPTLHVIDELPRFGLFILNVLLMMELNNRNALLRTYSRTVSSAYILLMLLTPTLTADIRMLFLQFCYIAFLLLLFGTYQNRFKVGRIFFAYLALGYASLVWLPVLFLLPVFVLLHLFYIYSFSFKAFSVILLSVITPYWCLLPFYILNNTTVETSEMISGLSSFLPGFEGVKVCWWETIANNVEMQINIAVLALISIISICSIIHYVRKSYEDKIHVRMLFYFFCLLMVVLLVAVVTLFSLPIDGETHFYMLMMLIVVTASPLIGHFITFTHTRLTNIFTIVFVLTSFILTAYNIFR